MEVGAVAAVHGGNARTMPLAVGAAKASVGHSEAASGQVGLARVRQVLEASAGSGNVQLRALNPLVGERLGSRSASSFMLPTQGAAATRLACGVSSFGYSGTIAHAVLVSGGGSERAVAFTSPSV